MDKVECMGHSIITVTSFRNNIVSIDSKKNKPSGGLSLVLTVLEYDTGSTTAWRKSHVEVINSCNSNILSSGKNTHYGSLGLYYYFGNKAFTR